MKLHKKLWSAVSNFKRGSERVPSADSDGNTNGKPRSVRCPAVLPLPMSPDQSALPAPGPAPLGLSMSAGDYEKEHRALRTLTAEVDGSYKQSYPLKTGNNEHVLLVDVAETDLQSFIRDQGSPELGSPKFLWVVSQMLGIASALHHLHKIWMDGRWNEYFGPISSDLYFKHTDLHPKNILLINNNTKDQHGTFKVADPGPLQCMGRRRPENGVNFHRRPPELQDFGQVSSSANIFSLGCIFVEVLLWLFGKHEEPNAIFWQLDSSLSSNQLHTDQFWTKQSRTYSLKPSVCAKLVLLEKQAGANHDLRALVNICACMVSIDPTERPAAMNVKGWLEQVHTYMDIRINCFDNIPRPLHSYRRTTYDDILTSQRITNLDEATDIATIAASRAISTVEHNTIEIITNDDNGEDATQVSDPRFDPLRDISIRFAELLNSSQPSLYLKSVPYDPFFAARPDIEQGPTTVFA